MNETKLALQQEVKDFFIFLDGDEQFDKELYDNMTVSMHRVTYLRNRIRQFFKERNIQHVIQESVNGDDGFYGCIAVSWIEDGEIGLYCINTVYP